MRFPSIAYWMELSRNAIGPVRRTFQSLDASAQAALSRDVADVARRHNRSGDRTMVVPAEYLEMVAVKR